MSLFSKLFGGGSGAASKAPEGVSHEGFTIYPDPLNDGGKWRVQALIEKVVDGQTKTHTMVRADTLESRDAAADVTLNKAKMLIDQQGDDIFK